MKRRLSGALAVLALLITTGCFEIEQTINLNKDMSGDAGVKIGIDFEPMVLIMTQMKREMEGKTGPPTKAELAEARAEFTKKSKSEPQEDSAKVRGEIESELPEGVKLLDVKVEEKDLGMMSTFTFSFDKVSQLVGVKLPSSGEDPSKMNVMDSPFEGLELVEDGKTMTIRSKPQNPTAAVTKETQQNAEVDPEMEKMMEEAFKSLRVAYRITAPFEVVSHNATSVEGNTLIWNYDLAAFKKMEAEGKVEDIAVMVVYKK